MSHHRRNDACGNMTHTRDGNALPLSERCPPPSRTVCRCSLLSDFRPDLSSDPSAWTPEKLAGGAGAVEDGGDSDAALPGCTDDPPFDATLTESSPTTSSHRSDQPCLQGCHTAGGSAKKIFAAAGTIHVSSTSRRVARSGTVHSVGGSTLTVDRCGNIYATADSLATDPQFTEPFVQNPTLHRMDKALYRVAFAGSCNQTHCHDFGGTLRWGVYF